MSFQSVRKSVKPSRHVAVETLEPRQMFSLSPNGVDPWVPYATLTHQDQAVATYPFLNGTTVRVAVIDRGIDYTIPQLGGGVGINKTVLGGVNFRDDNTTLLDDFGHGTTVAGLIAASGYTVNGLYNQGVTPNTQLISLKEESSADIKDALQWVIDNQARYNIQVVNLTDFDTEVQPGANNPTVYAAELQTLHNMGVFIVTPVGNDEVADGPGVPITSPAANANVMGVGGIDLNGNIWDDSRRGNGLDILGPASEVTAPFYERNDNSAGFDSFDDNYDGVTSLVDNTNGTSWAAAYVAGAATMLKQLDRTLTPNQIQQILVQSGDPTPDTEVINGITSYPRLNMLNAINLGYQVADDRNHTNYSLKRAAPVTFKRGSAILTGAKLLIGKQDVWSVTIPDTRTVVVKTTYTGPTKLPLVNLINSKGNAVGAVTSRGLRVTLTPGTYYLYYEPIQSLVGTYGFTLSTVSVGAVAAKATPAVFATAKAAPAAAGKTTDDGVLDVDKKSVFAR